MIQEIVKMQTVSNVTAQGGDIDTVNPVRFQYDQPAFMRHYRFYPVLKRPQSDIGQSIITNEGGRLFSLSIRLVVDYATLYAAHPDTVSESGVSIGRSLASSTSGGLQGAGLALDDIRDMLGPTFGGVGLNGIETFNSIHQHGR